MNVLVTGATGLIGNALARRLAARGDRVRVLVRDAQRAARVLPEGVEPALGDVRTPASLAPAMRGVERVFHAAGLPEQWQRDPSIFDRVNREGTGNVLRAARAAGVSRVVHTSTMDVFAAPSGGTLDETRRDGAEKRSAYERSKVAAEREADAVRLEGLEVVFVNPSAVYGPGPSVTGLNGFVGRLLSRRVPMVPPGGMSVVYVGGVADAHLAAAETGRDGERYLVSDTRVTNAELAALTARLAGLPNVPPTAPAWLLGLVARASAPLARATGLRPLVTPDELAFVLWNVDVDASKAKRELGFTPTPLEEGLRRTIAWIRSGV